MTPKHTEHTNFLFDNTMKLLLVIIASLYVPCCGFIPSPKSSLTTYSSEPWASNKDPLLATPSSTTVLRAVQPEGDGDVCWNPKLRKIFGTIASLGVIETGYLTWTKIAAGGETFCGADCASVLNGPYATVPGLGIPVATLGLVAYSGVAFLALGPLIFGSSPEREDDNRLWLTALSTTMGVFSVFLMTLLFGVLKESCPFCVFSAVLSISLAKLSWLGEVTPQEKLKDSIRYSAGGGLAAVLGVLVLFAGAPDDINSQVNFAGTPVGGGSDSKLLASASTSSRAKDPPSILSTSSPRALEVSNQLAALDAKMYGAYWCSHCYEQKERLGKEAMQRIPYVECSREGTNSQSSLCREKQIPGYPTWEVNGKLFPGEQALEDLADIAQQAK